jgi:hypothetical protein
MDSWTDRESNPGARQRQSKFAGPAADPRFEFIALRASGTGACEKRTASDKKRRTQPVPYGHRRGARVALLRSPILRGRHKRL